MEDGPDRRLKVALLVLDHFGKSLGGLMQQVGSEVDVASVDVLRTYRSVGLAMNGETDPEELGLPEASMAAFSVYELTRGTDGG